MILSISNRTILEAIKRGYRLLPNGDIIGARGRVIGKYPGAAGYLTFNVWVPSEVRMCVVKVHRFAAYLKYGDALFDAECVRHLDGNSHNNSPNNLVLGTHKENRADITNDKIIKMLKASREVCRKLTDDQVRSIRYWYNKIHPDTGVKLTQKVLTEMYGVVRSVIWNVTTYRTFKDVT